MRLMSRQDYDIQLDVKYPHGTLIDVAAEAAAHEPWFNQTLTQIDDAVVRLGIIEGDFHWHKHDDQDEFFLVLEGQLLIDIEDAETVTLEPQPGLQRRQGRRAPHARAAGAHGHPHGRARRGDPDGGLDRASESSSSAWARCVKRARAVVSDWQPNAVELLLAAAGRPPAEAPAGAAAASCERARRCTPRRPAAQATRALRRRSASYARLVPGTVSDYGHSSMTPTVVSGPTATAASSAAGGRAAETTPAPSVVICCWSSSYARRRSSGTTTDTQRCCSASRRVRTPAGRSLDIDPDGGTFTRLRLADAGPGRDVACGTATPATHRDRPRTCWAARQSLAWCSAHYAACSQRPGRRACPSTCLVCARGPAGSPPRRPQPRVRRRRATPTWLRTTPTAGHHASCLVPARRGRRRADYKDACGLGVLQRMR